jgi:hypothetical protein
MSISAAVLAEGAEHHRELFISPTAMGAVALVGFLVLLWAVTRFDPDR